MKAVEDFAFGFLFPQKEKKEIHCQKASNKCLNGLDIRFTGDKKCLNIRSKKSIIRFKARWYINEGDGKTKILMFIEFTEEALR